MTAQATPFRMSSELAPAPAKDERSGRAWLLDVVSVLAIGAAAVVVAVTLRPGLTARLTGPVLAVIELLVGATIIASARGVGSRERGAWSAIGAGVTMAGVGQLLRSLVSPIVGTVDWYPDVFSIAFYVLVAFGLVRLPHVRASRIGSVRSAIDVFVSLVAITAIAAELKPGLFDGGLAVPTLHALLLAAMLVAFLRRSIYARDLRLGLLLVALLPIVTAVEPTPTAAAPWTMVRWALAMTLISAAAWKLSRPQAVRSMILARTGKKAFVAPTVPVVGLGALLTARVIEGAELSGTLIPWAIVIVFASLALRSAASIVENRHLIGLERDLLLASISHELRTPLTAVSGFSQILSTSWGAIDEGERRELVSLIGSEAESLVDIIGDMNALARSELEAVSLTLERVQGKRLIADAIRLVFDLDGPLPIRAEVEPYLELTCDRRRMVQVLRALFENALRYGNGKILVVAKRSKSGRIIEVHDNGRGVERRYEKVIWKRFERGEHELNANVPGSGLGLAVVRSIARAHDGEARYRRSERLGGACFSIELPYVKDVDRNESSDR